MAISQENMLKYDGLHIPIEGKVTEKDLKRFWDKTKPGENGCILWTAACSPSRTACLANENDDEDEERKRLPYGRFYFNGRVRPSHRFSLYVEFGEIDPGPSVHHVCFNTLCVNPQHLRAVAIAENNAQRRVILSDHCQKGHLRTYDKQMGVGKGSVYISSEGKRDCRICSAERDRKRYQKKYAKDKILATHTSEMRDFHKEPKLTAEKVKEIRHKFENEGVSGRQLAREYMVSAANIRAIVKYRTWKYI